MKTANPHLSSRPFGVLLLLATLLATVVVVGFGYRLLAERRVEAEALARVQSRNLAQALDESISSTLQRIDLALGSVAGELEGTRVHGQVDRTGMERYLVMEGKLLPWPGIIWISDDQGHAIVGNRPITTVPAWETRWWFQYCKMHPDSGMVLSKPNIGFYTKKWVIPCVRRYNLPDGGFGGVVVIPFSVEYLQTLLVGYDIGKGGTLTVRDNEGGYIASYPKVEGGLEPAIGSPIGSDEFNQFLHSGADESIHFATRPSDSVPRIYADRRIKGTPMIAAAGLAEADYLALWRRDRFRTGAILALSLLGIWTLAWFFWQSWRSQAHSAWALAQSEERFRLAMDATSDGIWDWDVRTGDVYFSPSYTEMLGYDPEAFSAQITSWVDLIHPEDRDRVLAVNEACIQGSQPSFEVEYRMRAQDGSLRWILGRGKAIARDVSGRALRLVGTHVDVTQRKGIETELMEEKERYRSLFNNAEIGMFRTRLDGSEVLAFNDCYLRMLGMTEQDVLHRPSSLVWADPQRRDDMVKLLQAEGHVANFEFQIRTADGRIRDCLTSVKLFQAEGILEGSILDVTEAKQASAENARLQAQLIQAQKMESLGTLAGGIAHDMNNVLAGILGMAELGLEKAVPDSQGQRSFATIIRAAERAGKMVKSLLSFARQSPAENHVLDMNEILREEAALLERTTLAKVQLELDLCAELWPIRGDVSALTHAFMNLCVNALDAMPDQGRLTLRTRNLDPDRIEVIIEDTGTGMTLEVLAKAVEPYFTTKGVGRGTGLGLALVYSTVKAHGGELEIESQPGQGTHVRIRFPASLDREQSHGAEEGPPSAKPRRVLQVLLIDDDDLPRNATQEVLSHMGHGVAAVECGEDALALLETGYKPDVMILDINMPGLGGKGTLPRLRAMCAEVPVLLSTGRVDQAAMDLAKTVPGVLLLSKPFTIKELQQRLEQIGVG